MVVRNCVIVQLQIRDDTYNDVYFNKLSFVIATNFTNEIISTSHHKYHTYENIIHTPTIVFK